MNPYEHVRIDSNPLVSIVMPAYNSAAYIGFAIQSVLAQTYKNWELIIIDDGSRDNTAEVIRRYSQDEHRIRVLTHEKNRGIAVARNLGFASSSGDWIACLDSDDMWLPNKLERQLSHALEMQADFIFTGSSFMNRAGKPYKGILSVPERVTYRQLKVNNIISCSSVLIKKDLICNNIMLQGDFHEDYVAWLAILMKGVTAYGMNEPLLVYRITRESQSGNRFRSLRRTYGSYRQVGINWFHALILLLFNACLATRKYWRIKAGLQGARP